MREVTTHHDGHGLNESLVIRADEAGPGGASHRYTVEYGPDHTDPRVADIQFQKGPRNVEGSTAGLTDIALLSIVRDRLECFQAGEFACEENADALKAIKAAMHHMKARADNRARRGVLGTYNK